MRRSQMTGRQLDMPGSWGFKIQGPDIVTSLLEFDTIFQEQLKNTMANLAVSGQRIMRKTLDEAVTPAVGAGGAWGKARMAGERNGIRFRPYGNSEGRNNTGLMMASVSWEVFTEGPKTKARFGWIDFFKPYFLYQDEGFKHNERFIGSTGDTGIPMFGPTRSFKVPGAKSLPTARDNVMKRAESAYSAAWNEANAQWQRRGNKSVGSYLAAREASRKKRSGR